MSVVAWYGAIVSTISLALGIYLTLRDRPRLHVEGRPGYQVTVPGRPLSPGSLIGGYDPTKTYICITVSNRGRRSTTVSAVALVGADNKKLLLWDSKREGPREIGEGKAVEYLAEQDAATLATKCIIAYDQAGREWRGRLKK